MPRAASRQPAHRAAIVYPRAVETLARWASIGALALFASTCHRDPAPREPEPSVAAPAPAPTSSVGIAPPITASDASAGPSGDAAPDAGGPDAAPTHVKFGAAPSTTPGKILCGDGSCDLASQVCCEEEASGVAQCVPKPAPDQEACGKVAGALYQKHCDEKADCPGSESCCMTWGCSGGCPPIAVCTKVPCLHGPVEQCLPGGTCSAGFHCVHDPGSRVGTCSFDRAGVACGKERCSGDKPICCWNTKTRTGQCAASCGDEPDDDRWALRCTSPDDCGGYPCADFVPSPVRFTRCSSAYDVPDRSVQVFCRTLRDCPVMNVLGKAKACAAAPSFPGRAKICVYPSG